ncbi:MAG: Rrf2 family transcriptional regulator [Syntrophotaleaceae bacterium]
MRLSTKSRYGLRALFDMAFNAGNLPIQVKEISNRQEISPRYLEQIFQSFKKAGILKSKKGPQGGYFLAKNPEDITVLEIIEAAEGDTLLVACTDPPMEEGETCHFSGICVTQTVWAEAAQVLHNYFSGINLKDLCERGQKLGLKRESSHKFMYYI